MLETKRQLREVIETKSKQIASRDKLILEYREEHKALYKEITDLRIEKAELLGLIDKIKGLTESNKYNNEKIFLNKIKELVNDFEAKY